MTLVYVKTFGCSANMAESEMMAGMLRQSGKRVTADEGRLRSADAILVNVCTVKGEGKALKEISKLHERNPEKKMIVGGCVTSSMLQKIDSLVPNASVINTDNINAVVKAVDSNKTIRILDRKHEVKIRLPRIRNNNVISIIPVCQGCTSFCTYCSTKLTKGKIFSYPLEKILKEARESIAEGCREIWLTSQDNGDYGFDWDGKSHLPELMRKVSALSGDFYVRLGMTNPIGVMKVLDRLVESFKSEKVFKFLHIPVQSGNDDVLRRMARRYKVGDFKLAVEKFRKAIPEITISTDIICGFPGETKEQFNDTLRLVRETKPEVVNISRFVAREGTAAFRMQKQVHGNEKKERSTALTRLFRGVALERNSRWVGWKGRIIIDEEGKHGEMIGRNYAYKPVIIKEPVDKNGRRLELGDFAKVGITEATSLDLRGNLIRIQTAFPLENHNIPCSGSPIASR